MIKKLKSKAKKIIKRLIGNNKPSNNLPQIKPSSTVRPDKILFHVSAFNYGNAGDALLPIALQDSWKVIDDKIKWKNQLVYPTVDLKLIKEINESKGLIIGGGGLFLKVCCSAISRPFSKNEGRKIVFSRTRSLAEGFLW